MADTYGYGQPYPSPAPPAPVPGERPKTLTYAVYGMWLGAVLAVAGIVSALTMDTDELRRAMVEGAEQQPTYDPSAVDAERIADVMVPIIVVLAVVSGVVALGLWIWMAIVNAKGRGWARIVATVFGALAIASGLGTLANLGASTATGMQVAPGGGSIVLSAVNLVLAVALIVLLWVRPTNEYVNAVTAHRKALQGRR